MHKSEPAVSAMRVIAAQIEEAIAAPKCHKCGCLHQTVEALAGTEVGRTELVSVLTEARAVFVPKKYDCLGCPVCYPAIAANAFGEAYPEESGDLDLCPTEEPEERAGWPPLPGEYHVVRYRAPVAVCALNSEGLAAKLAAAAPAGLAVSGTMHTENLGIERVIKNITSNPHIRFLLLCGEDTQRTVGHLPGQSMVSLLEGGVDERGRILGARGKRPVLKNVSREEIAAFRQQIELVVRIGEESETVIAEEVGQLLARDPGPYAGALPASSAEVSEAREPQRLVLDPAGYFVVYPDARSKRLALEHYTNAGLLNCVMEGTTPAALYASAIERDLLTRLDHAAYLGRELARAEESLRTGKPYVQDRAAGELAPVAIPGGSGCGCVAGEACHEQ